MRLFLLFWVTPYHEHSLPGSCSAPNLSDEPQRRAATCLLPLPRALGKQGRWQRKPKKGITRHYGKVLCHGRVTALAFSLTAGTGLWRVQLGVFQPRKHDFDLLFISSKVVCSSLQSCFRLRGGNLPTQRCYIATQKVMAFSALFGPGHF